MYLLENFIDFFTAKSLEKYWEKTKLQFHNTYYEIYILNCESL